jgi:saccharopine dehydrogenase-like NADP-dependent oxidoreductase
LASYADDEIKALENQVRDKGILFLCEMGLDPGIDHMSAMQLLDEIRESGGTVQSFKSHCGGLVAPESDDNPWHYKITWNPRNFVMAGKAGAIYKLNGKIAEKYETLFDAKYVLTGKEVPVLVVKQEQFILIFTGSKNRYIHRTTLRYRDFMYGWKNIVELKLTDEEPVYQTDGLSLQDFFKEHLLKNGFGDWLNHKLSERLSETKAMLENLMKIAEAENIAQVEGEPVEKDFMLVNEEGHLKSIQLEDVKNEAASVVALKMHEANLTMKQLFYLGLDDQETIINKGLCSAADVLQMSLEKKLALQPTDKDMIVMLHEIEYSNNEGKRQSIHSSLLVKGEDSIHTAMAKTVGLPLGIAAKLILEKKINLTGIHIPVCKEIYEPVLTELKNLGISFSESRDIL